MNTSKLVISGDAFNGERAAVTQLGDDLSSELSSAKSDVDSLSGYWIDSKSAAFIEKWQAILDNLQSDLSSSISTVNLNFNKIATIIENSYEES